MIKRTLLLACAAFLLLAGSAQAQTATIDGITYTANDDGQTATVTYANNITTANILATVTINDKDYTVTAIGESAFYSCAALLQSITLPEGLQSIGDFAFTGCTALESIILPESLQSIGTWAFDSCMSLQSVTFPEGLQSIGSYAFFRCTALQSVDFPDGLQTISEYAFYYCSTLQSIDLPQWLQSIDKAAFACCYALKSVTFPEGLQSIGNYAFYSCNALQSIDLPQGLQSIGEWAFRDCTALQSITLPEGLQTIGNGAFKGCTNLRSVTLPDGLQTIDNSAFSYCKLTDIICHASTPPVIEGDTFDEVYYFITTLHVPSDAVAKYQTAEHWKEFFHIEGNLPLTAIDSVAADASIARYANGILTTSAPASITVYAQSGAVVRHAADATSLSLAGLPRGIYIISIAQDGQRQVMKVVR